MAHPQRPPVEDAAWLLERTEALCAVDTTTGHEDRGLPALRSLLAECGATVSLQRVEHDRHNVLATWGRPRLLFTTHLDTVPPYIAPSRRGDLLAGRGACDAKGQIVTQLAAIRALRARGFDDCAWLGVVGEETDSVGANAALSLAPTLAGCEVVLNGEPTENLLATGQRGAMLLRLSVQGTEAHSGMPELGRSALWPMLDWLQAMRGLPGASDPDLGDEIWNLGTLRGGSAPNVIPGEAEALLMVRSLPTSDFERRVRELAPPHAAVECLSFTPAETFPRVPGFEHAVVPFGSDAPRLRGLSRDRRVVLAGPGSIRVAHTVDEHVRGDDLVRGRDLLVALATALTGGGAT